MLSACAVAGTGAVSMSTLVTKVVFLLLRLSEDKDASQTLVSPDNVRSVSATQSLCLIGLTLRIINHF